MVKKILLLMLLVFLSACSTNVIDKSVIQTNDTSISEIVSNNQIQTTIARNDLGYDAWGRPKTVNDFSLFHGLWTYDIPKSMWIVKENGTEVLGEPTLALSSNGMLNVSNGAEVTSRRHSRYQPNKGYLYSTALIMPNSEETGVRRFGAFNDENGYFFSLENGTLYAVRRTTVSGVTTDIKEIINVPDDVNLSLGNVYDIQAQWRGMGNIKFFINLELVHTFDLLGTLSAISISNPALPIAYKVSAGTNNILVGCVDVTSEGGKKENRQYNSVTSGEQSLTNSETPVIVIKVNESYKGKLNTRDIALRRVTGYSDDNTLIRIYYTRDSSVITGGTWQSINGGHIQYQTLPTFSPSIYTKELVEGRIPALDSYVLDNPDEAFGDFYLISGDYIIVTLEAKSNTLGGVTIEWGEEI